MTVLSVDLASRRYADNGIALLSGRLGRVQTERIDAQALGVSGEPNAERFATALAALAEREQVRVILLDGPQGWRASQSSLVHLRHCEKATRTPGKTGPPGVVKPSTWTRMAEFSIALFDAFHGLGWPRLDEGWNGERVAIESFPTHAWRMLGHRPLPGKSATTTLAPWTTALATQGVELSAADLRHDDVQALVAGLAGIALLDGGMAACDRRGLRPFVEEGSWREGFILSPGLRGA